MNKTINFFKESFVNKVTLISFFLSLFGIAGVSFFAYFSATSHLEKKTTNQLDFELSRISSQINQNLKGFSRDVLFLTKAREIETFSKLGIYRNSPTGRKSGEALELLFKNLLQHHPAYTQVRLIGEKGKELIRVHRKDGGIQIVPPELLQDKSKHQYFLNALTLNPGEVSISDINLNREFGKISMPPKGMLRVYASLFDSENIFKGMVIINAEFKKIFRFQDELNPELDLFLANHRGDFLKHPEPNKEFGFDLGHPFQIQEDFPVAQSFFLKMEATDGMRVFDLKKQEKVLGLKRLFFDPFDNSRYLILGVCASYGIFRSDNQAMKTDLILLAFILALLSSLGINFLLRPILQPILSLTSAAKKISEGDESVAIVEDAKDEIGNLGRAFKIMVERLRLSREKAIQEKNNIALLSEAIKTANEANSVEQAIRKILKTICKRTSWDLAHVYLAKKLKDRLVLEPSGFWYCDQPEKFENFIQATARSTFEKGKGLPGKVLETRKAVFIPNVHEDDQFTRMKNAPCTDVTTAYAFPVLVQQEVIAVFEFFSSRPLHYSDPLMKLLPGIGTQIGRVMEREMVDEMKSQFITVAAHELRTPLASIQGFSELLKSRPGLEPGKLKKYAANIHHEAQHLSTILDDFNNFTRIEAGKAFTLEMQPCDAVELIKHEVEIIKGQNLPLLNFTLKVSENQIIWNVDASKIIQVIKNLLNNAIKYSPHGGDIEVRITREDSNIWVSVKDSGIGIDPEDIDKIYEKFFRAKEVISGFGGMGLGLTISKRLVELHGGTIEVDSYPGRGTSVRFSIPIEDRKLAEKDPPELSYQNGTTEEEKQIV